MQLKKLILFIAVFVYVYMYSVNVFAINYAGKDEYINKSGKTIMIYEAMSGTPTNTYLLKNQRFTVDWIEYEYYGTQIVAISFPNKSGGFLFIAASDPQLFYSLLSPID